MTPAAKLQDYLKHKVQGCGGQYRKVRWENRRGCPDCFVWWEWPKAAFIEVKADNDRLSPLQAREIERMDKYGIPVFIARSKNDIDVIVSLVRGGGNG